VRERLELGIRDVGEERQSRESLDEVLGAGLHVGSA
jgi:hypothetical protein